MKATNKKYCMIVYSEDERYGTSGYGLDFFIDNPAEGILQDIVFGDNANELMQSTDGNDNEGLFYILYVISKNCFDVESGEKIGSGMVERCAISDEINDYETKLLKKWQLEVVLDRQLAPDEIEAIEIGWKAFYSDPFKFKNTPIVDCINQFLGTEL